MGELKRELGFVELFCIASGAMISSGLFVLPGLAFAIAGPSIILSYLFASILMVPTMLSCAELCTAMPKAGGIFFFIDRSMGPGMGMLGGLARWLSLSFKSAFALLGIGIFVLLFNSSITETEIKLIAVACCLIFTIVNIIGVKLTGKIQTVITIALLSLLVLYVVIGSFLIQSSRYVPFIPHGLHSTFAVAGLVFIAYVGLNKIADVAGEIKDPERNIPRALFLSWGCVSLLYILVVFVTVGVVEGTQLQNSLTPISLGASTFMGWIGSAIMGIAALLAFATTANAGLLAASRTGMAMGRDGLLMSSLKNISKRGTPVASIILTALFMIFIILFLNLETLIKTASALAFLSFVFVCVSVIVMRESKIRNYQPKFKSPLYPWIQIFGIAGYLFLIFEMGVMPLLMVGIFIACGLCWYLAYGRKRIKREYALLHVIERLTGVKSTNYLVDEELREILIERDEITEARFVRLIKSCAILDFEDALTPDILTKQVVLILKEHLGVDEEKIYHLLLSREKERSVMIKHGIIIPSVIIPGNHKLGAIIVRCKEPTTFSKEYPPVNVIFIIISTPDEHHFYLHILMWLTQIVEMPEFSEAWLNARNTDEIRNIIISALDKICSRKR